MRTTEAAILVEIGAPLELLELELPTLTAGQVVIEIESSGVCHSQLNEIAGLRGPDHYMPHALGHEAVGSVLQIGEGVTKVRPGDRCVLSWLKGSGRDVPGTTYRSSIGTINAGAVTTFMRHAVVSENRLVRLTKPIDGPLAALLGCAVPTGAGLVRHAARVQQGETVAVIGCGGVGLMAVMAAAAAGASAIVAVDVRAQRLRAASSIGATHVIDASTVDPVEVVHRIVEGGTDVAIEAAGTVATMEQAVRVTRERGGRVVIAGNPPAGQRISIDPFDLIRGRHVTGSWGGDGDIDSDVPTYVDMVEAGVLPIGDIIGASYTLEKVNDALRDLEAGSSTRPILDLR